MLETIFIIIVALLAIHFLVTRTLEFNEEVILEININDAWELIGNQFTEPHKWATNFITSEPGGEPKLKGLKYLHRATTTENGINWQELDTFDPTNYFLTYHVSKGIPSIASKATGSWKLSELADTRTKLNVDFTLKTKGVLGFLMSPVISNKVGLASSEIVEELKFYSENGKPHPRKLEQLKTIKY